MTAFSSARLATLLLAFGSLAHISRTMADFSWDAQGKLYELVYERLASPDRRRG
jgi:hypothetical protein